MTSLMSWSQAKANDVNAAINIIYNKNFIENIIIQIYSLN